MVKAGSGANQVKHINSLIFNPLDILDKYLIDSFKLWNSGLSLKNYKRLNLLALNHPYARHQNYSFVALNSDNRKYIASCKLYKYNLILNNKKYKILGLGAIYTATDRRNCGYAAELISKIKAIAQANHIDAIILFSDIDPKYYEKFGFKIINSQDCTIKLADRPKIDNKIELSKIALRTKDTRCLSKIYSNKSKLNYFKRCRHSFAFKIFKNNFLSNYSTNYPQIYRIIDKSLNSYMLFELTGAKLRVLEICGKITLDIKSKLLAIMDRYKITKITCFSTISDKIAQIFDQSQIISLDYSNRNWGVFMILSLNSQLQKSHKSTFNFIQEFDYF